MSQEVTERRPRVSPTILWVPREIAELYWNSNEGARRPYPRWPESGGPAEVNSDRNNRKLASRGNIGITYESRPASPSEKPARPRIVPQVRGEVNWSQPLRRTSDKTASVGGLLAE